MHAGRQRWALTDGQVQNLRERLARILARDFGGRQGPAARQMGLTQSQISQLLNNPGKGFGLPTLLALSRYEGVPIEDLLGPGAAEDVPLPQALQEVLAELPQPARPSTLAALRAHLRTVQFDCSKHTWAVFVMGLESTAALAELQGQMDQQHGAAGQPSAVMPAVSRRRSASSAPPPPSRARAAPAVKGQGTRGQPGGDLPLGARGQPRGAKDGPRGRRSR